MSVQYSKPMPIQEIKAAGDGTWEVSGYVSTFGSVDRGGDVVMAGAFDRALADGRKVKFLYAHDQSQVLGTPLGWKVDDTGLFGRFKISRTRLGEDVHTLLKDGALDSFSIGFFIEDLDFDPETGVRMLKDIDLLEASVVAVPMNPEAVVTSVKELLLNDQVPLRFDEHCELVLSAVDGFISRTKSYADLRIGQGRRPLSLPAIERLQSVRTAADELLALQATKVVEIPDPPTEPAPTPEDEAQPPGDDQPRADYSLKMELQRRRLRSLGILEPALPCP